MSLSIGSNTVTAQRSVGTPSQQVRAQQSTPSSAQQLGYSGQSSFETNSVGRPAHTVPTGARLEKLIKQTYQRDLAEWNQRALAAGGREITLASGTKRVLAPVPKPSNWERTVGDKPMLSQYEKGGPKYPLKDFHVPRDVNNTYGARVKQYSLNDAHLKVRMAQVSFAEGKISDKNVATLTKRAFEGITGDDRLTALLGELNRVTSGAGNSPQMRDALNAVLAWRPAAS